MSEYLDCLNEARNRAWEQAKALLDTAGSEGRELSAEESVSYDRIMADIDAKDAQRKQLVDTEAREADIAKAMGALPAKREQAPVEDGFTRFLKGEGRSYDVRGPQGVSFRDLTKGTATAGGNTVEVGFYAQLVAHLIETSAILQAGATVLSTSSGEALQIPKTTAHSSAAIVAEGAAITESDPAFGQVTLNAYKYGNLIQVSRELVEDSSVDLLGYLAMQAGRAVGNAFGAHAITGTGSSQPAGLVTGSTLGVTGGTGVAGVFTADQLIDLHYSVIAPYRASSAAAWLMADSTLGKVRKLKDTAGYYLWSPAATAGDPDMLLGKPIFTDPNVAATGLSAKSVVFGDMSRYFVRTVNGIRFERSDEYAFNSDLVTFRCLWRADGVLVDQTGAVKHFVGGAT